MASDTRLYRFEEPVMIGDTVVDSVTTHPIPEPPESLLSISFVGSRGAVKAVARALGVCARKGDVFALVGPLGAGKTVFAQAVVRGAGVPESVRVTSPTFAIMQVYTGKFTVIHADLYRLGDARELDEIGLFSQGAEGLCIVEWPERGASDIPQGALWVELARDQKSQLRRRVTLRGAKSAVAPLISAATEALANWEQKLEARKTRVAR